MYKAIFIDIDGTLRNNQNNISKRTLEAIKNITEKGILVILCSGRPMKYVENISKQCYASNYIITSNGGIIYDYKADNIIYKNTMNKQAIIRLYELAKINNVTFRMDIGEIQVVNKLEISDDFRKELDTDIKTFVNKNDVILCTMLDEDFEKIRNLRKDIEKIKNIEIKQELKSSGDISLYAKEKFYYFIGNINLCKSFAIETFCKQLHIDLEDTIAIGDDFNDISMFKTVGYSVAMGNANDEVKKYADEITSSNEEDGVAIFLENLLKHHFPMAY